MIFDFFRKRDYTATLEPGNHVLQVKGGQRLLTAALEAGLDWPHDCRVGSCGACRCRLKSGRIKALTDFVYTLARDAIGAGEILACQTLLKSDVVIEVALGNALMALDEVPATIVGLRALTHDIVEMTVELERVAFGMAKPGQYVEISYAGLDTPRSYSFAHRPDVGDGRQFVFFIRRAPGGIFTEWLFGGERMGARLRLRGPYGRFVLREGDGCIVCVAGGSGLAPVYALLEEAVDRSDTRDCVVLFGARGQRDLYFMDEIAALGRRWTGRFILIPVLSEEPLDSGWSGARGLVTDAIEQAFAGGHFRPGDQGYLCGPPAMVDAAVSRLLMLGMDADGIYFDKFLDASTQPGGRTAI